MSNIKGVFGRLPEDDPLMKEIRERKARERKRSEPRLSWEKRDPEAWAREKLLEMFPRKKKPDEPTQE